MRRTRRRSNVFPLEMRSQRGGFGTKTIALLFGGAIVLGAGIGAGIHYWPSSMRVKSDGAILAASVQFSLCSGSMDTDCVVDGDTIRLKNDKIRLVGLNTPETGKPACPAEAAKGEQAKLRLLELLNSGSLAFTATADRDRDRYGRLLRSVAVNGRDVADILILEGLAEPYWGGKKRDWC